MEEQYSESSVFSAFCVGPEPPTLKLKKIPKATDLCMQCAEVRTDWCTPSVRNANIRVSPSNAVSQIELVSIR